jgi:hypothetical protein
VIEETPIAHFGKLPRSRVCAIGALGRARGVDMKPIDKMLAQDDGGEVRRASFLSRRGLPCAYSSSSSWLALHLC